MTTIINNPGENRPDRSNSDSSGGFGVIIGAILVILVLIAVLFFSIPYFRQKIDSVTQPTTPVINPTINVQLPNQTVPTASTTK